MAEFTCTSCELHKTHGRNYVKGRGDSKIKAKIFVIGVSPSKVDSDKGAHFMGNAAASLDKALGIAGLTRNELFFSYLVRCHPGEGKRPQDAEILTCSKYLDSEVSYIEPKVIVLLGDLAIKSILGMAPSASVKARIWDSKECAKVFTFASNGTVNRGNAFVVVAGPDPLSVEGNPSAARELARTFDMAAKLATSTGPVSNLNYSYAHNEQETFHLLSDVYKRCESEQVLSFDIETSGLNGYQRMHDPHKAESLTVAFSFRPAEAFAAVIRPKHRSERVVNMLRKTLEHPIYKTGHNGNFDNVLLRHDMGIRVKNYDFDTFVAAYALDQESKAKGLDDLAPMIRPDLGRWWETVEQYLDKTYGYLNCPDDKLLEYNAKDADATLSLMWDLGPKLRARGKDPLFYEILMPHYREIAEMEYFGVRMDVEGAKALGRSMVVKIEAAEESCLAKVGRHPHWWGSHELAARGIAPTAFKPFNLNSVPQLADLIYKELKAPVLVVSDKTKAPSTALEALAPLKKQFPFIEELLAYRKDNKFISSFIGWQVNERPQQSATLEMFGEVAWEREGVKTDGDGMLACVGKDSRLRPEIHIDGAVTGRVSITGPALQTIPKTKELRNLLLPAEGYVFVDADFKALELRILAMLSGDPEFIRVFREGLDPHSITASKMFGIPITLSPTATKEERDAYFADWNKKHSDARKKAKAVNFGIPYGEGAEGLADDLNVPVAEAQKWLDDWSTKTFPVAAKWLTRTVGESRKAGGVSYSMGRFRALPGFYSSKPADQSSAERKAKNTPIQGTGGDCTSLSIVRIHERFRKELGARWSDIARIVLEVHDQIVVEVLRERAEEIKVWVMEEMSRKMPFLPDTLSLEVDADIKERWGD
jgi:DNA polymerase-1